MIDAVRLTFAALRETAATSEGELRVSHIEGGPPSVSVGLDMEGRQHLLLKSSGSPTVETGIVTITVTERGLIMGGGASNRYLDVTCQMPELADVFDHFVSAVVERSAGTDVDLGVVLAEVLDHWRSFFTSTGAPPARETLTAVIGELLMLRDVARRDPAGAISVWVGPRGGRHDLRRGFVAVEVKTTRSHTSRVVTIHGEDQLLPPEGGTLHLHLVRLEEVAGMGVCVNDLADEIIGLGVARVDLFEALTAAGIAPAAFSSVGSIRFDVRERLTFTVDDDTPRIVPSTFAAGHRPPGIIDVTYRADLDHIAERALTPDAYSSLVDSLCSPERQ